MFVCYLFVWEGWGFGSYSADVDLLYPPTHTFTKDTHNTGKFIPYSSRIVCGFFNVPQGTNEQRRYLWDGAYIHTYILNSPLPIGAFQGQWNNQRNNRTQQQQLVRIPTGRRQTSWLFTSAARKLSQGLPGTNSTSGQSGFWTRDRRISRQAP